MYIIEPIVANKTTITPNMANSGGISELGEKQNANIKPSPIPPSNTVKKVTIALSIVLIFTPHFLIVESLRKVDYIRSKLHEQPNANKTPKKVLFGFGCFIALPLLHMIVKGFIIWANDGQC